MEIWLGDFDVVAEDLIETDFEGVDAGTLAFALFRGSDDLLAVLAEVAEFVKFDVVAGAEDAGFGGGGGRLVGDGTLELFADVGELVEFFVEIAKKIAATGLRRREEILEDGELSKGFAKGKEFARAGEAERDTAGEAFEVLNAAKLLANFAAHDGLLQEMGDGAEAGFDGAGIEQWAKHPGAEKAGTHSGDRGIQSGDERGGAGGLGLLGEDGRNKFEIADGDGIEDEGVLLVVETNAVEVLEGFDAGGVVATSSIFA